MDNDVVFNQCPYCGSDSYSFVINLSSNFCNFYITMHYHACKNKKVVKCKCDKCHRDYYRIGTKSDFSTKTFYLR